MFSAVRIQCERGAGLPPSSGSEPHNAGYCPAASGLSLELWNRATQPKRVIENREALDIAIHFA